ncbi:MAG: hypothetical protein BGO12_08525 [Verrucomicrobia bacterium 61-8]|nr:MAG: hypothetical protein BGO12_08525 [Verrucomicrobia bacterium 61-8]
MVGAGFIFDWHHKAFSSLPDVEFVGLTANIPEGRSWPHERQLALEQKASALNLRLYPDFAALAGDESLDALIIGSINPDHYGQILAGLKAGKHLLVEKPVVTDLAELATVKDAAQAAGRIVFPAHNFVYRGAVRQAKEILESGALGRIIHSSFISTHTISPAHASGWRSRKALAKGGALMDSGHHLVYQMIYLLGYPKTIKGLKANIVLTGMECEDTALVNVQFADGSVATLMQSWASGMDFGTSGIRILGEKGNLTITDALYFNGEKLTGDVEYGDSFVRQAEAFVHSVKTGTPPLSTLDDAEKTLKLIYASYADAEE